jgi:hypothetical protein
MFIVVDMNFFVHQISCQVTFYKLGVNGKKLPTPR